MRLIEAEKAKDVIHEYFKSLMVKDASGADVYKLAVGIVSCLEHDANLMKAIDELPSAEQEAPDINVGNIGTISRQVAIDTLNEQIEQCNKALGSFDISLKDEYAIKVERASLEAYKEQLENMPSIQPERKTGRWIESNPQNSKLCRIMTCSECGKAYIVNINVPYEDWTEAHKFCVECGTKMEGGAE